ncbi:hypothetical protein F2Q68_00029696 [Brassica cretica]|uniref:CCHC-type domain-containing protein n=1 Tax=Brassica cretica TaxID=69181 RepID=A0A8S9G7C8_BRACR|nr:hypothetical protein F2Q68_00029696 [Brassica cretica]
MGRRKKHGASMLAASTKLGRLAARGRGTSAATKKTAILPATTAHSVAGDVQEEKSSPDLAGELDLLGESQKSMEPSSPCAVEGSSSSAKTISDPQPANLTKAEDPVSDSPPSAYVVPTLSARIQKSTLLQELGTPTYHVSGAPFVMIPDENIESAKVEFKEFVFARFPGDVPPMERIIGVINAIWARTGPRIFVHKIGEGTYLLKVTNERTRDALLMVPVELRGVPYLLFNQQSLSRIATVVGKPVSLAPETERKENFVVAKVEVEISVSYPWLPEKCTNCGKFGHRQHLCPSPGSKWRPIVPPATRKDVPPSARSMSRESKGRKRSRPRRSARARRRDRSRGSDASVAVSTGPSSPQSVLPSVEQECQHGESNDALIAPKESTNDLQVSMEAGSEESSENSTKEPAAERSCIKESSPKQVVSLDRNVGFSTVHVYHEDDGSASGSDRAGASNDPFFLVLNRKGALPVGWKHFANSDNQSPARIIVVWHPTVSVTIYQASPQVVTCGIFILAENLSLTREVEISVSYPWLPEKCTNCGKFGHRQHLCPSPGSKWRPIVPPATRKDVPPSARSMSRESKGRKRSRPGRSARARRRDRSRGSDASVAISTGPSSPQSVLPSVEQECQHGESIDALIPPKESTDDLQLSMDAGSEESSENSTKEPAAERSCIKESSPK